MATDNPQFTSLSIDPSSNTHQATSYTDNSARAQKYNENSNGSSTSFLQSTIFTIVMIAISVGLLVVCIILAIVLSTAVKSASTESSSSTKSPTAITSTNAMSTSSETTTTTSIPICGIQEIQPSSSPGRIYGGTEAIPNSWPWMVYYQEVGPCVNDDCPVHVCGGTLIKPQYVLTAAHCIYSMTNSTIKIVAGLHDKTSSTEDDKRQIRTVETIFRHPIYDLTTITDDIAILRLSSPFELTTYVQIACLPGTEPQVGDTVTIAGWGAEVYGGPVSNILMQTSTQVVGDCAESWAGANVIIDETRQICVVNVADGASMCSGDSGGPILAKNDDQWVVFGASSFVSVCNTTNNIPNVYTRVAHYLPWINSITQRPL